MLKKTPSLTSPSHLKLSMAKMKLTFPENQHLQLCKKKEICVFPHLYDLEIILDPLAVTLKLSPDAVKPFQRSHFIPLLSLIALQAGYYNIFIISLCFWLLLS